LLVFSFNSVGQVNFSFNSIRSFGVPGRPLLTGFVNENSPDARAKEGVLVTPRLLLDAASAESYSATEAAKPLSAELRKVVKASGAAEKSRSAISSLGFSFKKTSFRYPEGLRNEIGITEYRPAEILYYARALKKFAKENGYDTSYAFLGNMGMISSRKRFFVVNLVTMQVEQAGLVSHGRGQGKSRYDRQYSNSLESKCTSLGRYKIMGKYEGSYGLAYRMAGLDSSNDNAHKRNIVLHSMGCIPDTENNGPACISEGCPAVSVNFLSQLSKIIDGRRKPVLLWVFDSNLEEVILEERAIPLVANDLPADYHRCTLHHPLDKIVP
jgi:hypothetical protein